MKLLVGTVLLVSSMLSFAGESCYTLVSENTRNIEVSAPEEICLKDLYIDGASLSGDMSIDGSIYKDIRIAFRSHEFTIGANLMSKSYSAGSCDEVETLSIKLITTADSDGIINNVNEIKAVTTYVSDKCHGRKVSRELKYELK